jgi:hypothetical protein
MVCDASEQTTTPAGPEEHMKRKITVDGITYELECEDSTLAVLTKALADRDSKITSLDSRIAEVTKAAETQRARADGAEADLKKAQAIVADSTKPGRIQEAVKARLVLERTVKPLLTTDGKEPELADLSDSDIKRKVVLVHDSEAKLDGVSAEYLEGRYEGALKALAAAKKVTVDARTTQLRSVTSPNAGGVTVDSNDARKLLREESERAWEKPLNAQQ